MVHFILLLENAIFKGIHVYTHKYEQCLITYMTDHIHKPNSGSTQLYLFQWEIKNSFSMNSVCMYDTDILVSFCISIYFYLYIYIYTKYAIKTLYSIYLKSINVCRKPTSTIQINTTKQWVESIQWLKHHTVSVLKCLQSLETN